MERSQDVRNTVQVDYNTQIINISMLNIIPMINLCPIGPHLDLMMDSSEDDQMANLQGVLLYQTSRILLTLEP
jgi:hypothetical protein